MAEPLHENLETIFAESKRRLVAQEDPSVLVVPFVALLLTLVFTSKWFRDIIMLLNTPIRNASTGLTYCSENSTENGEEFEPVTHCSCSPPF